MNADTGKQSIVYSTDRRSIKSSITKGILIVVCFDLILYISAGGLESFKENLFLAVVLSLTIFFAFIATLGPIRNHKIYIHKEYIGFQALYNPKEPTLYKWKDISMIIIGDVEVKHSRLPYTVFGVQIFYTSRILGNVTSTFEVYSLMHIVNHEELIEDIKRKCIENDIKFQNDKESI